MQVNRPELVDRYEEMRAYVAGSEPGPVPRGLALLVRYGVPAWAEACLACPPPPALPVGSWAGGRGVAPASVQAELVMALAGMALSCRRG